MRNTDCRLGRLDARGRRVQSLHDLLNRRSLWRVTLRHDRNGLGLLSRLLGLLAAQHRVDHRAHGLAYSLRLLALLGGPVLVAKQKVARRRIRLALNRSHFLLLERAGLYRLLHSQTLFAQTFFALSCLHLDGRPRRHLAQHLHQIISDGRRARTGRITTHGLLLAKALVLVGLAQILRHRTRASRSLPRLFDQVGADRKRVPGRLCAERKLPRLRRRALQVEALACAKQRARSAQHGYFVMKLDKKAFYVLFN